MAVTDPRATATGADTFDNPLTPMADDPNEGEGEHQVEEDLEGRCPMRLFGPH
jgi:hypothetical protein